MLRRYLHWFTLAIIPLLVLFLDNAIVHADADFESVRVRLTKDHSGKRGDPKDKYFHESVFHPHYDGRFADRQLSYEDKKSHLIALIQSYLSTMSDLGAETWLMHGTLMGWWWNRKILPWDSDIDVQMSVETLFFLASYYNMTIFHYHLPHVPAGRDYLFEINPGFATETPFDKLNMIDARWIDTETGLFIDVTTVRPNVTARALGIEGALQCKDNHHYLEQDMFPLRDSVFEDTRVKIPFQYAWLLEEEYSKASLTRTEFERHQWNQTTMQWEPMKPQIHQRKSTSAATPEGQDTASMKRVLSIPKSAVRMVRKYGHVDPWLATAEEMFHEPPPMIDRCGTGSHDSQEK